MAKGWFPSWPEGKVMMGWGWCSSSVSCLLLLVLIHLTTSDRNVIPCASRCKLLGTSTSSSPSPDEIARANLEEQMRQAVADFMPNLPNNPLHTVEAADSQQSQSPPLSELSPAASQQEVKVIRDWQLPAITNDRRHEKLDDPEKYGEARRFKPMGSGAFLFIQFGAYRGGPNTFAVVGLGTKSLHQHGNPGFECSWVPNLANSSNSTSSSTTLQGHVKKYYPDSDFSRQYKVIVVNCTFESDAGVDGSGGRLEVVATHGSSDHTGLEDVQFVALTEDPNTYDGSVFGPPYRYDYLYCGSPIFGSISAQRMREWVAYHVHLFGPRSHFILYDAGGIQDDGLEILRPWIKLGFITLMNFRQAARYDVYYFSQFMVNNDCLFRAKTLANWTFFFDVDEYLHVPENIAFDELMAEFYGMGRKAQVVQFRQNLMNHNHCREGSLSSDDLQRQWGFEKLVYRCTEDSDDIEGFFNKKYMIQARYALDTGVHTSEHSLLPEGLEYYETVVYYDWRLSYYHYRNSISQKSELCEEFVDAALHETRILNATHVVDTSMAVLANAVREFENRTIGPLATTLGSR